jgi:prophage regulatory protein
MEAQTTPTRLLRTAEVQELTTLNRTTIWQKVKAGTFPPPLKIAGVRIAWRPDDIAAWMSSCETAAHTAAGS